MTWLLFRCTSNALNSTGLAFLLLQEIRWFRVSISFPICLYPTSNIPKTVVQLVPAKRKTQRKSQSKRKFFLVSLKNRYFWFWFVSCRRMKVKITINFYGSGRRITFKIFEVWKIRKRVKLYSFLKVILVKNLNILSCCRHRVHIVNIAGCKTISIQ